MTPPRFEAANLTKRFPGVLANDAVSLHVEAGEIHALLGENGAGKSTMVKMIYGLMRPDGGEMRLDGQPYSPAKPAEARAMGVGMVFQHFSLFDALTVAENIALGISGMRPTRALSQKIIDVSNSYGLALDPDRHVQSLSAGERQRVEIVRCLLQNPRMLIMDEPTSVLTPQEAETLFETLRRLAADGCSILYISHKLDEIRALCSRATVLRHGRLVGAADPRQTSARELAEMMIGGAWNAAGAKAMTPGRARLEVQNLSLASEDPFGVALKEIGFTVHAGEILGIAGIAGNGQTELLDALSGERRTAPGCIRLNGAAIGDLGPTRRRRLGLCAVPEERLGHGAAPELGLGHNVLLSARTRQGLERRGFLSLTRARAFADDVAKRFDVRSSGVHAEARTLSGGNLQKFIVGREIAQNPDVLCVLQPTWGVDAAAAAAIHTAILTLAADGAAVLVISQDLGELLAISSRFSVIADGRVSEPRAVGDVTVEEIGLLMGGQAGPSEAIAV